MSDEQERIDRQSLAEEMQREINGLTSRLEAVTKLQKDNYGNATDTHIALADWVESLNDIPAPRTHTWDDSGERCLNCGDKDWMGGPCRPSPAPKASVPVEWELIQKLTEQEGHWVTIIHPNPDFGGDAFGVVHSKDFGVTEYSYFGDSYLACLHKAINQSPSTDGKT